MCGLVHVVVSLCRHVAIATGFLFYSGLLLSIFRDGKLDGQAKTTFTFQKVVDGLGNRATGEGMEKDGILGEGMLFILEGKRKNFESSGVD